MSKRLYYFNIGFDLDLGSSAPDSQLRLIDEMSLAPYLLGESGDYVISDLDPGNDFFAYLQKLNISFAAKADHNHNYSDYDLKYWGLDSRSCEKYQAYGVTPSAPSHDLLQKINSKEFSNNLSAKMGYPHGVLCSNLEEVYQKSEEFGEQPLVLKPLHGSAGRGFIFKRESAWSDLEKRSLERFYSLEGNSGILEPWRERIIDFSLGFEISATGDSSDVSYNRLIVNRIGTFTALIPDIQHELLDKYRSDLNKVVKLVTKTLKDLGYSGPVGVDFYFYYDHNGEVAINPLSELNVRRTMAYLPGEFKRKYPQIKHAMLASLTRKQLSKLQSYPGLWENLKDLHFDQKSGEGVLFMLPLYYEKDKSRVYTTRNLILIAAKDESSLFKYLEFVKSISAGDKK